MRQINAERLWADLVYSQIKDYKTALIELCKITHKYPYLNLNEMIYCLEMAIKHDAGIVRPKEKDRHLQG